MIEGLRGESGVGPEQFAIICKTHHALVDGVSGVDLRNGPLRPRPRPAGDPRGSRAVGTPPRAVGGTTRRAQERPGIPSRRSPAWSPHGIAAAVTPGRSIERVRDAVEGVGEIVWAGLNPAPQTPLNVEIGPHRRYAVVRQRLSDYKEVKDVLGGTVNDVVLAVVSGALADWLHGRGIRTEGLELRALVPVSVRTADDRNTLGNKLVVLRGPLPVTSVIRRQGSRSCARRWTA